MRYMLIFYCLLMGLTGRAQEQTIVSYRVETVAAGDSVQVKVILNILPGWYIYAPVESNTMQGMQVTQLRFHPLPEGFKRKGRLQLPGIRQKGSYAVFEGSGIMLMQTFQVNKAGTFSLKGKLTYQACNQQTCYPPVTEIIEEMIQVN